jgi:hypothetical protein
LENGTRKGELLEKHKTHSVLLKDKKASACELRNDERKLFARVITAIFSFHLNFALSFIVWI